MIESISAVTLATHNMPHAVRFYRVLGFEIIHALVSETEIAGSIATTIRRIAGLVPFGIRHASIMSRAHEAPGTSSRISPSSSCLPRRVPAYRFEAISARNAGGKFEALSPVRPLANNSIVARAPDQVLSKS